ncbi:hypothetical protein HDE_09352 [Halotydeus destructor]|nr:hypothetical protein HDE_09352 [Halotydeus destructor]
MSQKRATAISGILLGDELGLVKRIDVHSTPTTDSVTTLNRDLIGGELTPDKAIISIKPFLMHNIATPEKDEDDSDEDDSRPVIDGKAACNQELSVLYLITSKPNNIYLFNSMNNSFSPIKPPVNDSSINLIGAAPINRNNIVVCYDNGLIFMQNIERELLQSSSDSKKKAVRLLGLELEPKPSSGTPKKLKRDHSKDGSNNDQVNNVRQSSAKSNSSNHSASGDSHLVSDSTEILFSPNYNTANISLTCFEVCSNRLAVAGKNVDLKVFDLETKQCIFTAKSSGVDWLGLKAATWVSDLTWIGPILPPKSNPNSFTKKVHAASEPAMIATCSRSDAIIRIYDVQAKTKKPLWLINLKDSTFNNDSNPPSFVSVTSTCSPVTSAVPTQQLILGTTMGRMIAIDLRFNSKSHRQLGVFKGFGGGAIRGISFVANCGSTGNHKIVSCSLDRFVRVHTFITGANQRRQLDAKYYVKTRPTCIQPILSSCLVNDDDSANTDSATNVDHSDAEFDEEED